MRPVYFVGFNFESQEVTTGKCEVREYSRMSDDILYEVRPERNARFIGHLKDILKKPRVFLKIAYAFGYSKSTAKKRLVEYLDSVVDERQQDLDMAKSHLNAVFAFEV